MLDYFEEGDHVILGLCLNPLIGVVTKIEVERVVVGGLSKEVAVIEKAERIDFSFWKTFFK